MKKKMILAGIMFVFSIFVSLIVLYGKKDESVIINSVKKDNTTTITGQKKNIKSFTLSAAGDCTIGWDSKFGYQGRFDDIYNKVNDPSYFFKNVYPIFNTDDITIVNLEGTFTESNERREKSFNFKAPKEYVNVLTEGGVDIVSFANNHAYDYSESGYQDTLETLRDANIPSYGYNRYLIKEINGIKVGFFALMDIYGERYNEVDHALNYLKDKNCDLIIASMHMGIEKDYELSEFQTKMGHYLIDHGVDLVIGHHPHVIQGIEKYKDKYIVYSLANFVFGGNKNPNDKDTFIFQQTFTFEDDVLKLDDNINIIPASISSVSNVNNYQPTPLEGEEKTRVLNKILQKSTGFEYNN